MAAKRTVTTPVKPEAPKPLQRRAAAGKAREEERMEAKEARAREVMTAHRLREAELEKQGYWF